MNTMLLDQEPKSGTGNKNQVSPPPLKDPLYIDVRTPQEFEGMHISGARNIPLPDLHAYVDELKTLSREHRITLLCRTQNRVKIAYEYLINQGLTNCGILEGGIAAWVNQGKPVVRGQHRISLEGQVRAIARGVDSGRGWVGSDGPFRVPSASDGSRGWTSSCRTHRLLPDGNALEQSALQPDSEIIVPHDID